MSFHVSFDLSTGLKNTLYAPKGKLQHIIDHRNQVEEQLGIEIEEWNGEKRWNIHWRHPVAPQLDNKNFCRIAGYHNHWVQMLYADMMEWSKHPVPNGDAITPEEAKRFWRALRRIDIPVERWSEEHYREEMKTLYAVMRGDTTAGITFDAPPLTTEQAEMVIILFSFLDPGDQRLAVCVGQDELSTADEYLWCDKCGAINWEDINGWHTPRLPCDGTEYEGCCPLREELELEEDEEDTD